MFFTNAGDKVLINLNDMLTEGEWMTWDEKATYLNFCEEGNVGEKGNCAIGEKYHQWDYKLNKIKF